MSTPIADTAVASDDGRAKRNVAVLVFAQAVLGSQLAINIIVAGLAGAVLADDPALATLPISIVVVGSLVTAPVMSLFMGRYGRRAGFWVSAAAAAVASALCARALFVDSFALFLAGSVLLGVYQGTQGFIRFAAADTASDAFKPKAISWVLAGGLLSAFLGRWIVREIGTVTAVPYAGAYLAMIVLNVVGAAGLWFLDIPVPPRAAKAADTVVVSRASHANPRSS
jgi:MFS family permease